MIGHQNYGLFAGSLSENHPKCRGHPQKPLPRGNASVLGTELCKKGFRFWGGARNCRKYGQIGALPDISEPQLGKKKGNKKGLGLGLGSLGFQ